MKETKNYIKQWEALTELLTKQFCDKYGFDYEQGFWVRDVIGETFCVDDDYYYIDFKDIMTDLKLDTEGKFKEWYNYDYHLSYLNIYPRISYPSWLKGAPLPFTQEQISQLYNIADEDREEYARQFYELNRQKNE